MKAAAHLFTAASDTGTSRHNGLGDRHDAGIEVDRERSALRYIWAVPLFAVCLAAAYVEIRFSADLVDQATLETEGG